MAEYAGLWDPAVIPDNISSSDRVFEDVVFHATLNIVLALGCQISKSLSLAQRQYQANEFYRRSQKLVSIETLDTFPLSVVQLLLLHSLYISYASMADRCWIMIGAAFRVAMALGLHTNQSGKAYSQLE